MHILFWGFFYLLTALLVASAPLLGPVFYASLPFILPYRGNIPVSRRVCHDGMQHLL